MKKKKKKKKHPKTTHRHTTVRHVSLAFSTPRGSFNATIIDGALQIQELPFAFGLLARYHLVPLKLYFHGIPNCQGLLPKSTIQRPIQGQSIPKINALLPNHNLPVMIKADRPIPRLVNLFLSTDEVMMQPFGGDESPSPTTLTSLTSRGEAGGQTQSGEG